MTFLGIQKFTLLDYPSKIGTTLFSPGCNFSCPFCHNGEIVKENIDSGTISENDVLSFLRKRCGLIEGVCITGGEPTLQKGLMDFIIKIKALGFLVKLDTNGEKPDILKKLLEKNLLSYVAMDVKNSLSLYGKTIGIPNFDTRNIEKSIEILMSSTIDYEFRTTVVKEFHTKESLNEMAVFLKDAKLWRLQEFKERDTCIQKGLHSINKNDIKVILKQFLHSQNIKIYE